MKEENLKMQTLENIVSLGISEREAKELIKVSKDIDLDYKRLCDGYPVQYLIGHVNFYGNIINVDERVLIPRYETEGLCEKVMCMAKKKFSKKIDILDLCSGSGAIGITLKKNLDCDVTCADISQDALDVSKSNASLNNCDITFVLSDLFDNIKGKYDVIVSNPPYVSYDEEVMETVSKYEPSIALYAKNNGLYFYDKILSDARKYLKEDYIIAFEIGASQGEALMELATKYFPDAKASLERDLSGRNRYFFLTRE